MRLGWCHLATCCVQGKICAIFEHPSRTMRDSDGSELVSVIHDVKNPVAAITCGDSSGSGLFNATGPLESRRRTRHQPRTPCRPEHRRIRSSYHGRPRNAARAREVSNPLQAAKAMERALAVALLIYCALRISTLRALELTDFTWSRGNRQGA